MGGVRGHVILKIFRRSSITGNDEVMRERIRDFSFKLLV